MDLDSLVVKIKNVSNDLVIQSIADKLQNWKEDDTTIKELNVNIDRHIGHSWIQKDDEHEVVYDLWSSFRDNEINDIDGMTMNERLYTFNLMESYESCFTKNCKLKIYTKLHATI